MTKRIEREISGRTIEAARRELTRALGLPWRQNRRGVSQEKLAQLLGTSRQTVYFAEALGGDRRFRLSLIGLLHLQGVNPRAVPGLLPWEIETEIREGAA